ncbi:amidophosphoribosyltransferase [Gloeomargarita lithophora Alchichica-D10]|uniref:Amidophosphoribosyltransferase n=1 Tax=Gloeomargarita lithophora Alchichica-D10 TaxID=1188229 RepID=A0A1J0AEB0_9CYAN|nr:amidophosphoribosyltransferase [Gloeomargarita lithophora]APB34247.1 amidophosphoribosyltransferase [Gloeomargarita lithophora Alchichica-D10]
MHVPPDKLEEACGVFGVYAPAEAVAKLAYFGLYALQHRGQESAGIATFDQGRLHYYKHMGLVSQVFREEILRELPGQWAVGHNRYSTTGSSRVINAQPVVVPSRLGEIALAHNGNLVNTLELRQQLPPERYPLYSTTDSEIMAQLLAQAVDGGADWVTGAIQMAQQCQGAFSLVIGTPQGILGMRDSYGVRPLVLGTLGEQGLVLASETCALDIIGADYLREVEPGEWVWLTPNGFSCGQWQTAQRKLCVFEMIYFARPDSVMEGKSLYAYRRRLGEILAQESPVCADLVIAVPDSGVPAAIGFAQKSGISYAEGLIKNRYVGRTFIQPTQAMRETGIRMKLNPLRDVLQSQRVVVVDDSIVRGTTSRKLVQALREAGVREVHMRISSPPVTHPCFYGIDTDNQEQLIAARQSVSEITQHLEVDSLAYLSWAGMFAATGSAPQQFCSACFTGDYPVPMPDALKRSKLMLEQVT